MRMICVRSLVVICLISSACGSAARDMKILEWPRDSTVALWPPLAGRIQVILMDTSPPGAYFIFVFVNGENLYSIFGCRCEQRGELIRRVFAQLRTQSLMFLDLSAPRFGGASGMAGLPRRPDAMVRGVRWLDGETGGASGNAGCPSPPKTVPVALLEKARDKAAQMDAIQKD